MASPLTARKASTGAEWKPPSAASACEVCGGNINSTAAEQVALYDPVTGDLGTVDVRGSAASCCESSFIVLTRCSMLQSVCLARALQRLLLVWHVFIQSIAGHKF